MRFVKLCSLLVCVLAIATGCQKGTEDTGGQAGGQAGLTKGQPDPGEHRKRLRGKVITKKEAGKYTFLELDLGGSNIWVAGQKGKVEIGDSVEFIEVPPMVNFFSKTLDKTFEKVYFLGSMKVNGEWVNASPQAFGLGAAAGGAGSQATSPNAGSALSGMPSSNTPDAAGITVAPGSIKKVAGGHTVEELFKGKAEFNGKSVKVRGKVQKFLTGIMGKNFIHLLDGTGTGKTGDLTMTTSQTVKVGDTVVAEGMITADKDFGAGYKYDLIMEDAKLTVE